LKQADTTIVIERSEDSQEERVTVNQSAELPEGNVLLYPTIQRWFNCISTESRIFIHKQIVKTIRLKIENDEDN
jgi:hypothetical protein